MPTTQFLFDQISNHITKRSGRHVGYGWYAGITSAPRRRVFEEHNVSEKNGSWIWRKADTSQDARKVERLLLAWGCTGGTGGGDTSARFVYAYEVTRNTEED